MTMPNPFSSPMEWRKRILDEIRISSKLKFTHRGFICALVTSRCHIGCEHCMFASNMDEGRTSTNTMTHERVDALLKLTKQSNTGYLLVSGGGEGFLELPLMYRIIRESSADVTWMVTSGFWGFGEQSARRVLAKCLDAHRHATADHPHRKIIIRVSLDQHHIDRIGRHDDGLHYIRTIIRVFEQDCAGVDGFSLMFHAIEGEEPIIEELARQLGGSLHDFADEIHSKIKATQRSMRLQFPSGLLIPVSFAKLLLSDMAADLRDEAMTARRIKIWETDAYINEQDRTGLQLHDAGYGNDMLVIYDGRIAGGWQCEMPDISINIDEHDYAEVMKLTLSDPAALATMENGHRYRFRIIEEVNPKACIRAKAINIRDYTSPILLEEDRVKLYYTIRAVQDFRFDGRLIDGHEICSPLVWRIIDASVDQLREWYEQSGYDVIKQYRDRHPGFDKLEAALLKHLEDADDQKLANTIINASRRDFRRIDQWRLLLLRIRRNWYDISTWPEGLIGTLDEAIGVIDERILKGKRPFEGLSMQSLR